MNWNDIPLFLAVADQGTLAGAARALKVNHSTVFRRLAELESTVGARLFERLPSGYVLTAAGEAMLPMARSADESMNDIAREIVGHDAILQGKVRITTAPNLARTILPAAVTVLRGQHPGISVEVLVSDSDYNLIRREADMALRATTKPPEPLVGRRLMALEWWVCAPRKYRKKPRLFEELAGHPLIGPDESLQRLKVFQRLGAEHDYVATSNDLTTMAALSAAGIGLCVLPSDQQHADLDRLFKVPGTFSELWLLTHPDLHRIPRVKVVWDVIFETCENWES